MAKVTVSGKFRKISNKPERLVNPMLLRVANIVGQKTRDYIVSNFMGAAETMPNRLARNTGNMERKTKALAATRTSGSVTTKIVIGVKYANTHFSSTGRNETVIYPRHAEKLTVPLYSIINPATKRPYYPAKSGNIKKKYARNDRLYGSIFGKPVTGLFNLKESVTVPVRVQVKTDIEPAMKRFLQEALRDGMERTFN